MNPKRISILVILISIAGTNYACDSTSIIRFANGNKNVVQKFKEGKACGKWSYYSKDKALLKRERYKNGKLIFTWIYNEEGRIAETINKRGKHRKHKHCNCK